MAAPSLLWPQSTTGKCLRTQKEGSVGVNGAQLSGGQPPSPPGTLRPEPGFPNTGRLGSGH